LTPKQRRCLLAISDHVHKTGNSPTYRELQEALGNAAVAPIQDLIEKLHGKGYLSYGENGTRNIRLNVLPIAPHRFNLFGEWLDIPNPHHALEVFEDIPRKLLKKGDYALCEKSGKTLGILRLIEQPSEKP
jgi:SOS-response transcriptional repressor LexA